MTERHQPNATARSQYSESSGHARVHGPSHEPDSTNPPTWKTQTNRWNRTRYRLYAPVYDWLAKPWEAGRRRAIERLDVHPDERILILGSGTGQDLEYLPNGVEVVAVDLTEAMARRTAARAERLDLDVEARVGDAQSLPFDDAAFDVVLLHLVLSVVPKPSAVVAETARVLRSGGRVSIFDKFVQVDATPPLWRRAINPLARLLFADLNRNLEPMLSSTPLQLGASEPFLRGLYSVTIAQQRPPTR